MLVMHVNWSDVFSRYMFLYGSKVWALCTKGVERLHWGRRDSMGLWPHLSGKKWPSQWAILLLTLFLQTVVFFYTFIQNPVSLSATEKIRTMNTQMFAHQINHLDSATRLDVNKSSFTGSEDLRFPLEIDMPEIVRRTFAGLAISHKPINQPNFTYVIPNSGKCSRLTARYGKPPELLILIKTAPMNFLRRDAIRLSWGNEKCWGGRRVVRLFLLGTVLPTEKEMSRRLESEANHHNDIVQQDFHDNYYNNTYKLMLGFEWAIRFCSSVPIIMFVDDDFFVYPKNVVAYIEGLSVALRERLFSGYIWQNAMPVRKEVRKRKWSVTWQEYPNSYYPPYVAAGNFFVSMTIAKEISVASKYTQYLRFDDVFLGIILKKLVRTPMHLNHIYAFVPVNESSAQINSMLSSHHYGNPSSQLALWSRLKCREFCIKAST
ncbi:unnamed protein product [Calicophoron daubneyi]|uniref:Hexosyltransferase n=1 Tax=Calicophoron daubneyi TaxID=300641 RepID=A0AAV2TH66_CALDB